MSGERVVVIATSKALRSRFANGKRLVPPGCQFAGIHFVCDTSEDDGEVARVVSIAVTSTRQMTTVIELDALDKKVVFRLFQPFLADSTTTKVWFDGYDAIEWLVDRSWWTVSTAVNCVDLKYMPHNVSSRIANLVKKLRGNDEMAASAAVAAAQLARATALCYRDFQYVEHTAKQLFYAAECTKVQLEESLHVIMLWGMVTALTDDSFSEKDSDEDSEDSDSTSAKSFASSSTSKALSSSENSPSIETISYFSAEFERPALATLVPQSAEFIGLHFEMDASGVVAIALTVARDKTLVIPDVASMDKASVCDFLQPICALKRTATVCFDADDAIMWLKSHKGLSLAGAHNCCDLRKMSPTHLRECRATMWMKLRRWVSASGDAIPDDPDECAVTTAPRQLATIYSVLRTRRDLKNQLLMAHEETLVTWRSCRPKRRKSSTSMDIDYISTRAQWNDWLQINNHTLVPPCATQAGLDFHVVGCTKRARERVVSIAIAVDSCAPVVLNLSTLPPELIGNQLQAAFSCAATAFLSCEASTAFALLQNQGYVDGKPCCLVDVGENRERRLSWEDLLREEASPVEEEAAAALISRHHEAWTHRILPLPLVAQTAHRAQLLVHRAVHS